jgi:predicted permease
MSDFTLALRTLARRRIYTFASVVTLAVGIGATSAVFSVVDAMLIRPLPFREPERLVGVGGVSTDPDGAQTVYSPSQIEIVRWQAAQHSFLAIGALEPRTMAITGSGDPEVVTGAAVSATLFPMLGIDPKAGRAFSADEEQHDAPVAIVSERFAQLHFDDRGSAVGQHLNVDGHPYEIVGIMPGGFRPLLFAGDVWIPLHAKIDPARQGARIYAGAGRLRPGVTPAQAEQELAAISKDIAREFPAGHAQYRPRVRDLREQLLGQQRPGLLALGGGVLLLLLLACANVMNLTVGHLADRRGEMTLRAVIGASRWRLTRMVLAQTFLVAALGGVLGLVTIDAVLPALLALRPDDGQLQVQAGVDWRVVLFAAAMTCGTAIISGVIPALRAHAAGAEGGVARLASARVGGGPWERRVRASLVVAQLALAVVLLCGATAFSASLTRLLHTRPGFSQDGVLSMQMKLSPQQYPDVATRARFVKQIVDRIGALPGVAAAGTTQTTFLPNQSMQAFAWIEGRTVDAEHAETIHIRHITPGYFSVLRVPVIEGRTIDERDQIGTPTVCMVSARFARQYWPNESAIGHRIRRVGAGAPWMTIVGVAGDVMDGGLGVQMGPTIYVAYLQQNTVTARVSLVVRTEGDPLQFARGVQQAIRAVDAAQAIDRVERLEDLLAESAGEQRFRTMLIGAFAIVGLVLALVGIYGVTAAAVRARAWEAGIRMALGATPTGLVASMVRESAARIAIGSIAGLLGFAAAGRLASGLLYRTSLGDPLVLAAAVAPLVALAIVVSLCQARKLASVDPALALRDDR